MASRLYLPPGHTYSVAYLEMKPPEWLTDKRALAYWHKYEQHAKDNGTLAESTVDAFAALCMAWSFLLGATSAKESQTYFSQWWRLANAFGLIPSNKENRDLSIDDRLAEIGVG